MGADGKVVTFEAQVATHGGLGGPQIHPFIARSPECPLTPESVDDAVDLYSYFMRRYTGQLAADERTSLKVPERLAHDVALRQ
jgi:hypothetical protein